MADWSSENGSKRVNEHRFYRGGNVVHRMLTKILIGPQRDERPQVAMEVSPDGVVAAAQSLADNESVFAFEPLLPSAIVPGSREANLRNRESVVAAIRSTLEKVVIQHNQSITLILPNAAVRIFVLEFDTLPASAADIVPVLRFRLRKMVPFDIEDAAISYQVLSQKADECRLLITALPVAILDEYESAVREAGFEPGAVLPSSLAALEALDSPDPVLAAFLSGNSLTTSITSKKDLLLYRRVDLPDETELRNGELQRGIAVALAYFEDLLARRPRCLHYAGSESAETFAASIAEPDLMVVDLAPRPESSKAVPIINASIAGVVGALSRQREHLKLTLNLATRPFADPEPTIRRLRIGVGVLGFVALILALSLHFVSQDADKIRARDLAIGGEIANARSEMQRYEVMMKQPQNAAILTQVEDLNRLFDEKAFSWTLAMEDLETVLPAGVQVTTLEPIRDKEGQIILKLRVLGPRDRAVELLENLEHSKRFFWPRIVGETSESNGGGPNEKLEPVSTSNLVNFDLLADYNPPAPGDALPEGPDPHSEENHTSRADNSMPQLQKRTELDAVRPGPKAPSHAGGQQ